MKRLSEMEFLRLVAFVRERYGINLEKKRVLIETRLDSMLEREGYSGYAAYLKAVCSEPEGPLCQEMINRLSTNYTFFFREPQCFTYLLRKALPTVLPAPGAALRLWCAACSSGEEAYTLSMVLSRALLPTGKTLAYSILATDINTEMLAQAQAGRYGQKALDTVPKEYLACFCRQNEAWQIRSDLVRPITFQRENILDSQRESCMDMIICRNVMIYFAPEERERLLERLALALRPGGYLFIGSTENIGLKQTRFQRLEPAVYRKRLTAE